MSSPFILILTKTGTKPISACSDDDLRDGVRDAKTELTFRPALACGIRTVIERRISIIEAEIEARKCRRHQDPDR